MIPAYNNEETIGSLVLEASQYVLNVVVVDDNSQDQTAEIAKLAGAQVHVHPQHQGEGSALATGFNAAMSADIIVILDLGGHNQPSDIPKLMEPIFNNEADLVNGSRYLNRADEGNSTYRKAGKNLLDAATNISGDLHITDSQSGFRAFAKRTFSVFSFRSTDYSIKSEMLVEASNAGLRIKEVPVGSKDHEKDVPKKNAITHGVRVLVKIVQDMQFNRPLYYFAIPGIIMLIIGIVISLKFFNDYLIGKSISLLPTALAALITLFGAFITFTGLILHSVSQLILRFMKK